MKKPDHIEAAARAYSDLNMFAAIASILESGFISNGSRTLRAAERIMGICSTEQARLLTDYEAACARANATPSQEA